MAQDNFEIRGELVAHGKAPFNHKEGNNDSYFVTTKSKAGNEHTQWGADLERAVKVADANVGDKIHLTHTGAREFDMKVPDLDAQGNNVGEKTITAKKVTYDLNITEKAPQVIEKNNPHLDALKAIPELSNVSNNDLGKLAALRQVAEENTSGKARTANVLAKFDASVKDPSFREAALTQIAHEKSENSTAKTQSKEPELTR